MYWKTLSILGFIITIILFTKHSFPDFKDLRFLRPPQEIEESGSALTLNKVFDPNKEYLRNLNRERIVTLITTGDVMLGRKVNEVSIRSNNFNRPFEKTADFLREADIVLINLEGPLVNKCPITTVGMIFCGDTRHVEGLKWAGIDVANLANNHTGNHGVEGLGTTIETLHSNNILTSGISEPAYKEIRSTKFAFLGYNLVGTNSQKIKDQITREISQGKQKADIVVVSFHWGEEYQSQPNKLQKEVAHLAVDHGADIVIGNHPHWIQPIEVYKNKVIVYSHGNFVFDQNWSQKTREGIVGKFTFDQDSLIDAEFLPIEIQGWGQPTFVQGEKKQSLLNQLKNESLKLIKL